MPTLIENVVELLKTEKYRDIVDESVSKGREVLIIDFGDLEESVAQSLLTDYKQTMGKEMGGGLGMKYNLRALRLDVGKKFDKVLLQFRNVPNRKAIRELTSDDINTLLDVNAVVTSVFPPQSIMTKAIFKCPKCGEELYVYQEGSEYIKPDKCGCGRRKGFILQETKCEWDDYQEVYIQENPEDLTAGDVPRIMKIKAIGKQLMDACKPGDIIDIICTMLTVPSKRSKPLVHSWCLEANRIEVLNKDSFRTELAEDEIGALVNLSKHPRIKEIVVDSIYPSVYGYKMEKYGLALSIFGGTPHRKPDITHRGTVNALLLGDPSTAKSRMLMATVNAAPKGIYASGRGASGVGLTAAVIQSESGWGVAAGSLVLADLGICAIDEIEKMDEADRTKIHEAMSMGTVSIHKADKHMTLNARTAIIAAANPSKGRYDEFSSMVENISLPPTILSRFDLIFIIKDKPNEEKDRELMEKILKVSSNSTSDLPVLDRKTIKKYILYAKTIKPKLNQEAIRRIIDFYVGIRKMAKGDLGNPIAITARQGEGLRRLTEASARMALKSVADENDAELAIELLKHSLETATYDPDSGAHDIALWETGKSYSKEKKKGAIIQILNDNPEGLTFEELADLVGDHIGRTELRKLLRALEYDIHSPDGGNTYKLMVPL